MTTSPSQRTAATEGPHRVQLDALSFDIEDWFHMTGVPSLEDPVAWTGLPSLVERYTNTILEQLSSSGIKATFFVLGWIAEKYPHLVRMIAEGGHEIGCHGHWHRRIDLLSPGAFEVELRRALSAIDDACGVPVHGFRAPTFSIIPGTEWALDVLLDCGLRYDASLFPASRENGGYPCEPNPFLFSLPSGRVIAEFPMSVMRWGPLALAFSGGGYMRLLPFWAIRRGFEQVHRKNQPVVVYLHPRDFATDCPRISLPPLKYFKSYVGLRSSEGKFTSLLKRFRFSTCQDVLIQRGLLTESS